MIDDPRIIATEANFRAPCGGLGSVCEEYVSAQ
jgi:hypothetical protein